jgi:oligopeptide transport system substrate-binding protein
VSAPSSGKLFICYRRSDSADIAGRLYDRLASHFGRDAIFKDVDSIPLGIDFRVHVEGTLKQCNVVLVIIGRHWLETTTAEGTRRLDDETDYVRIEIQTALAREIPIVPILVHDAHVPKVSELPAPLQGLAHRNGAAIRADPHFNADVSFVIGRLEKAMRPRPPSARISPAKWRRIFFSAVVAAAITYGGVYGWRWVAEWRSSSRSIAAPAVDFAVPASRIGASGATPQLLRVGISAEPGTLDPQLASTREDASIGAALFEGLVTEDPRDLHPVPALAQSWEISSDQMSYTFHLRPNATWSNGEPITAFGIAESFQRVVDPALGAPFAYLITETIAGAKDINTGKTKDLSKFGIRAIDALTLKFELVDPSPFLLRLMANNPVWTPIPITLVRRNSGSTRRDGLWAEPGVQSFSGAFVLESWAPGKELILTPNARYWDAASVRLREVHFIFRGIMAVKYYAGDGKLHIVADLSREEVAGYRASRSAALRLDPYFGINFIRCNVTRPPLDNKMVRQALSLAIDRQAIAAVTLGTGERPALHLNYAGVPGYPLEGKKSGSYDEARRLLTAAGYPGGRGCPKLVFETTSGPTAQAVALAIQQSWRRELGLLVEISTLEPRMMAASRHATDFMLQSGSWLGDYVDPHTFLEIWRGAGGNNRTQWGGAEFDTGLQSALRAKDESTRYAIYRGLDAILDEEVPAIPVYYFSLRTLVDPSVKGYYPTLLDHHPLKHVYLDQ